MQSFFLWQASALFLYLVIVDGRRFGSDKRDESTLSITPSQNSHVSQLQTQALVAASSIKSFFASANGSSTNVRLTGNTTSTSYARALGVVDLYRRGILVWVVFLILVIVYECWPQKCSRVVATRDARWDMVKFWCMVMVLWSHFMGYWQPDGSELWLGFPHELVSHFHMPGFSFVSGYFASRSTLAVKSKASKEFDRSKASLRDLLLAQLTVVPLVVLFPLTYGEKPDMDYLSKTPLLALPRYWYLDSLFVWQLLTPIVSTLSQPIMIAGIGSIIVRSSWRYNGMFFYFVFFVLGFVLGGGGKSGEEQSLVRSRLDTVLVDIKTRVAACCLLTLWLAAWNMNMPQPLMMIFSVHTDLNRDATSWALGGWFTDAARMCFDVLLMLAFITIIFMMPSCEILSSAGSRTLYVYVLHWFALIPNPALRTLVLGLPALWKPYATFILASIFTLILGSKLTKALLHLFVQPQWLVDLCMQQPKASIASEGKATP